MEETELEERVDRSLHDIFVAMNLDRVPLVRENGNFSAKNLSVMEMRILRKITETGEIPLKDIRVLVQLPNSTLTSIIKRFEHKGLITRLPNPEDRRSYVLRITRLGRMINDQHRTYDIKVAKAFIERMDSVEEAEEFIRLATKATRTPLVSFQEFANQRIDYDSLDMEED